MIISIDLVKAIEVKYPFIIKTLNKVGLEGTYCNIKKAIYERPTADIILNGEKQSFSPKVRNKTKMSTLTIFTEYSTRSPKSQKSENTKE